MKKLRILIILSSLIFFSCSNISYLSIVSTKDYNPNLKYRSIGAISAKSHSYFTYLYTIISPFYEKTTIDFVVQKAIQESGADYITNVKIYESDILVGI